MKYQVMPDLTPIEYEALKADIAERGVLVPVEVDETGAILDGHHRVRAWQELRGEGAGLADYPRMIRVGLSEEQKRNHARSLNVLRRHLSKDQRDEVMRAMAQDGASPDEIAAAVGVHRTTVDRTLSADSTFANAKVDKRVGKDGKARPAKYQQRKPKSSPQATIFAASDKDERKALKAAGKLQPDGGEVVTTKSAVAAVKQQEKDQTISEAAKQAAAVMAEDAEFVAPTIYLADAIEFMAGFDDDTFDLLLTDPPYSTDIDDIVSFAAKWLPLALAKVKRTGRAYVCIGAYPAELLAYLSVLQRQDKFIVDAPLIWTYRNTLGVTPKMKYNLNYQMVLHLYSPDSRPLDNSITNEMFSVQDINAPDGRLGDRFHAWQKPDELARRLIKHSTLPGERILDPFACTGTFPLMAARMERWAEACDINADNLRIAQSRGCHVEMGQ